MSILFGLCLYCGTYFNKVDKTPVCPFGKKIKLNLTEYVVTLFNPDRIQKRFQSKNLNGKSHKNFLHEFVKILDTTFRNLFVVSLPPNKIINV